MLHPASAPITRLGLQIPNFTYPGVPDAGLFERVSEIAATAERSGFDSVWVMDHLYQIAVMGPPTNAMLEALHPARGARRAHVERPPRHARHAASRTATRRCSRRSRPRSTSSRRGARSSASARPGTSRSTGATASSSRPPRERFERLTEAVQICRLMFREDAPSFDGTYYRIENALNIPRPVTPGGPPILIGGSGEKWTLRLVAERGDACNLFGDLETIRHKLSVLEAHCDEIGRDSSEITKTRLGGLLIAETDAKARGQARSLRGESRGHGGAGAGLRDSSAIRMRSASRCRHFSTPGSTGSCSTCRTRTISSPSSSQARRSRPCCDGRAPIERPT